MRAVPLDRAAQALLELDLRPPAGELAQLRGVDVLAVDLAARRAGAADVGLDVGARRPRRSARTTSSDRVRPSRRRR